MSRLIAFVIAIQIALTCSQSFVRHASAETRALIVGIDDYSRIRRLLGAKNDAIDIRDVLTKRGVMDMTVLLDGAATRQSVLDAFDRMVDRAIAGDLVIVSFAGHGSSERWGKQRPADAAEGESYEVFLLRDFAPPDFTGRVRPEDRKAAGERILGREIQQRLLRLEQKGARTVFVADTCHGGGLTRQLATVASEQSYRAAPPYPTHANGEDPIAAQFSTLPTAFDHLKAMPSLTFLAAVDAKKKSPEVPIPPASGIRRGALSYAFARALEGEADANRDGAVTREEIFQFIRPTVRQFTDFAQVPELQPSDAALNVRSHVVIDLKRDLGVSAAPPAQGTSRTVRMFVVGGGVDVRSKGRTGDLDIVTVPSRPDADLIWDPPSGEVVSGAGDTIATGVTRALIDGIAEREVARREVLEIARLRPWEMRLGSGDRVYRNRERLSVEAQVEPAGERYYVLFNIASDGTVQYLYPRKEQGDPWTLRPGRKLLDDIQVRAPFGADLLVLVVATRPLDSLAAALRTLDGERAALDAIRRLRENIADDVRITTQGIFTAQ